MIRKGTTYLDGSNEHVIQLKLESIEQYHAYYTCDISILHGGRHYIISYSVINLNMLKKQF